MAYGKVAEEGAAADGLDGKVGHPLQRADGKVAHEGPRQPTEQGNGHLHIITHQVRGMGVLSR